jgi:hypothetical protein
MRIRGVKTHRQTKLVMIAARFSHRRDSHRERALSAVVVIRVHRRRWLQRTATRIVRNLFKACLSRRRSAKLVSRLHSKVCKQVRERSRPRLKRSHRPLYSPASGCKANRMSTSGFIRAARSQSVDPWLAPVPTWAGHVRICRPMWNESLPRATFYRRHR